MAHAGPQCSADRNTQLGAIGLPLAHAVARTVEYSRVQLAAAVALADAAAVWIAEPEPDGSSDARAEPAADHGAAVNGAPPLQTCVCGIVCRGCACEWYASVHANLAERWMEVACVCVYVCALARAGVWVSGGTGEGREQDACVYEHLGYEHLGLSAALQPLAN